MIWSFIIKAVAVIMSIVMVVVVIVFVLFLSACMALGPDDDGEDSINRSAWFDDER